MSVFITYSHDDIKYKEELVKEISHLNRLAEILIWHDGLIRHGEEWRKKIEEQLQNCNCAIVLVSNPFLDSKFCQDNEVPKLIEKCQNKIYPIIVHPSNWEQYNWLNKLELRPKDAAGKVIPLSPMHLHNRKKVYSDLCKDILNSMSKEMIDRTSQGANLGTPQQCENYAQLLANKYYSNKDGTLSELIKSYMLLYEQNIDEQARALISLFRKAVAQAGITIEEKDYKKLLDLLESGLPINPVHLKDISCITADTLLNNPGYADLLLGIRLTETDYCAAIDHLKNVQRNNNHLLSCNLIRYVLGQCYRKIKDHRNSKTMYNIAIESINTWTDNHCQYGPRCSRDALLVECYRGYGAVLRSQGKWKEADEQFKKGEIHLTDEVSKNVRADFLYSYGYYVYERAYKSFMITSRNQKRISKNQYRILLCKAKELYEKSINLNPTWAAPHARLQIVNQLIFKPDLDEYIKARVYSLSEVGIEPKLTAVICGFAVLLLGTEQGNTNIAHVFDSKILYHELEQIFKEVLVAKAPRECHAFDSAVILGKREIPRRDLWLKRVYKLLQTSANWVEFENIENQIKELNEFHKHERF